MTGIGNSLRHASAFFAEQQDIVGPECELIDRVSAFCRKQYQTLRSDRVGERIEPGMSRDSDMIDVVHRGAPHAPIVPRKSHWLDEVHRRPHAGTKPEDGPDIAGNFWFEQSNAHGG